MEPAAKKTKLTDHFRVALKPRDLNVALSNDNNKQKINLTNEKQQQHLRPTTTLLGHGSQQTAAAPVSTLAAQTHHKPIALKETRSSRENLHLETLQRNAPIRRGPECLRKVEIITIEDEDDEATEIDEDYQEQLARAAGRTKTTTAKAEDKSATGIRQLTEDIFNYDESVLSNVFWEPHYACDSFEYDRKQELKFALRRREQPEATTIGWSLYSRADLVEWLVHIQVRFSLDHEPLYMAVKLADHYQARKRVAGENLVLLYVTSMYIAAKFDERQSYITIPVMQRQARIRFGVKYTIKQIIKLEVDLLTTLDFNLRFPLSYGFLRRFARCTRSDMQTINLARYILESSLMEYDMIEILESEIAAGSLLLAHEMLNHTGAWDATARYYTGYEERQLVPLIIRLNEMLLKFSRKRTAIRRKYSHELFMEVAKIPPMQPELLLLITSDHQATR